MLEKTEDDFSFTKFFTPLTTLKAINIIAIIGLIIYFKIFTNGFVWDDETFIIYNPEIHNFNLWALIGNNMFNSSPFYRPIPAIYFSVLYNLFSTTAFFYHFLQLVLHIVDTSLLFVMLAKFFKKPLALFLSLIFLIHPINIESVAYIGATQSEIYFLLGILAVYLSFQNTLSIKRIVTIHILLLCALLTKEVSLLFFPLIYFYRFLHKYSVKNFVVYTVTTLVIYVILRTSFLGGATGGFQNAPISELPLVNRIAHIPIILFYYIKSFFFPTTFAIDQVWTISTINWETFYLPLIFTIIFYGIIIAFGFYYIRFKETIYKNYVFFLIWYIAGLSMLVQIFPLDMTVADRWFYFPIVGLLGIIGIALQNIFFNKRYRLVIITLCCFVILGLSYKTFSRLPDWETPLTLYKHDLAVYDSPIIEEAYGVDLGEKGNYPEAILHLKRSIQYQGRESNLANLANTYQRMGDLQSAILYYQQAMETGVIIDGKKKHYENTYTNYASALFKLHEFDKAKIIVLQGIQAFPSSNDLQTLLVNIDEATSKQAMGAGT